MTARSRRADGGVAPGLPAPRERILAAAFRLFAEQGFACVTMRSVAECVGLHNSSLFHHFESKREIARHVFDDRLERLLPLVEPLARDDPPSLDFFVERILAIADRFMDEPEEARFVLRVILDPEVFLAEYTDEIDPDDSGNPVVRLFSAVWGWLDRARTTGEIRPVRVYQATRNLMGILLFDPAYSLRGKGPGLSPTISADRRHHRLLELEAFVRGSLAPR